MKRRLLVVALGMFFLFSLLIAQYFKIQIVEGEKWSQKALSQHEFIVREPFRRGSFYANTEIKRGHPGQPQPLVFDVTKFHLFADSVAISSETKGHVAQQVAKILDADKEMILQELSRKSRSRRLAMWLSREQKQELTAWWYPFAKRQKLASNALFFVTDYQRSYPYGKLLGQVLHTIRDIKDEMTHQALPTGGLESYFNEQLQGSEGKRVLLRSPLNKLDADRLLQQPEDGADVYLTINHCIQAIMEEELHKGVVTAQAKGGWAVMMEAKSGEILGCAQYPFFNPTHYRDYFNDPTQIEETKVKAITDAFELGSIMKPITIGICLKANEVLAAKGEPPLFSPEERVNVTRTQFPGRASKPLCDLNPHKALNMYMAVQKSSNVYMAEMVDRVIKRLGDEWYREELIHTFGFGTKTGIELPAEASGLVPRIGKVLSNGALEWSVATPYSLSFGYNMLATSMQMLRAVAVFASGGLLVEPTLVKKIVRDGKIVFENVKKKPNRVLSRKSAFEVIRAMKYSTKPGGTGARAEIAGYTEAGKTGTAEKIVGGVYSKKKHISSFIGFVPATFSANVDPLILVVSLDEP
ncbi:MAG: peptidoglycan D,D-transpeptidase FtsI family protein, partial [Chlamydiales bacterium]